MSETAPILARRADIDWIRVAAFGILILYHVGLVYAPWDWHVHSPHTFEWLRYAALVTNPWRLTLLFMVSGVALRFMSRRRTAGEVLRARAARLLPPFLFGVLVLVPPQSYTEALEKDWWSGDFLSWWLHEFSREGFQDGIPLNHLWFVEYIMVYSLAVVVLLASPRLTALVQKAFEWVIQGSRLFILPILYLALTRQLMFAHLGITNHLDGDWYNHAMSFGVFLMGFALAPSDKAWAAFEASRWPALAVAVVALPVLIFLEAHPIGLIQQGLPKNIAFAIDQWATICAVLGFASRHIRTAEGPVLRYLTDAVFPCYLAHQTILVLAAHQLKALDLPAQIEAPVLVSLTLGGSLLVYEIVRRIGPIRPLWGLKPRGRKRPPAPPSQDPATAKAA